MNLLITGGCGFIGSNFIHYWLATRPTDTVVNLDALTYAGNLENLKGIDNRAEYHFVKGSICDRELTADLMRAHAIDTVVNFAAESHVDRSIMDSAPFVMTNVVGTQRLLDAALQSGVRRFIQISTDEVYGALSLESAERFGADSPLQPNSPYAAAKAAADLLARSYFRTFGLPVLITRCSNNYGPYQFPEKLIPLMIVNAMKDEPLPVYGDGQHVRDWIHVRDHCEALDAVIHRGHPGEVYNIGGGNERPNLEVIHMILDLLDKPRSLIRFVKDRPGHDRRYAIDSGKIQRELEWRPKTGFRDGLKATVDWYRENHGWAERIVSGEYQDYYRRQYGNA